MCCPKCGKQMELLRPLYFNTGKSWFGCKSCNYVIEESHCSVSGQSHGFKTAMHNYIGYLAALERNKQREAKRLGI